MRFLVSLGFVAESSSELLALLPAEQEHIRELTRQGRPEFIALTNA